MSKTANYFKLVYVTPALYMAGGVERVLTLKANYFAEHFGYDITIILFILYRIKLKWLI